MNNHNKYNRSLKGRYRELKRRAKRDNIPISITYEQYTQIAKEQKCFYADCSLENTTGSGLNRIDANKGYTTKNVRPCCGICNQIMSNFSKKQLASRVFKIIKRMS